MDKCCWTGLCILGLVVCMGCGQEVACHRDIAEEYFGALFAVDAIAVRNLQHDDWMYGDVSESVLRASIDGMQLYLGEYRGVGACVLTREFGSEAPCILECVLKFERMSGTGILHVAEGDVTEHEVRSPGLPKVWRTLPEDLSWWRRRGHEIVYSYASGSAGPAYNLMTRAFQRDIPFAQFRLDVQSASQSLGSIKGVDYVSEALPRREGLLELHYRVHAENAIRLVRVVFWVGLSNTGAIGLGPAPGGEGMGDSSDH